MFEVQSLKPINARGTVSTKKEYYANHAINGRLFIQFLILTDNH
ncbi:hypothetical protein [Hazenella coriacea]|nr:hypothetical protein [Hazenella coriacea]